MLTIISDAEEIRECQQLLEKKLDTLCDEKTESLLGYQGGSSKVLFQYSTIYDFWYRADRLDNRYLNGFGLGKPNVSRSSSLVVEINTPIEGINRRIAGAFCRDQNGETFLLHRGRIGGGKKGIGKKLFIDTIGLDAQVTDGNKLTNIAFITSLSSERFAEELIRFIKKVNRIKTYGTSDFDSFEEHGRSI